MSQSPPPYGLNPPPPPPPYPAGRPNPPAPRPRTSILSLVGRLLTAIMVVVLMGSIVLNLILAVAVAAHMHNVTEKTYAKGDASHRIVVIPVSGVIDDSTATYMHEVLVSLNEHKPAAIILRVDSPGGGVSASDRIWHELGDFRKKNSIPMVASFGGLAASGGYYISAGADYIVVEPTTLTGSIGVIAQSFTVEKLLDKVGVTPETITSTHATKKDELSPFHAWTDTDRAELRKILDQAHGRFVDIVYQGRKDKNLTLEEAQTLATGAVMTAKAAIDAKLADEEGYLEVAIAKAGALAKLGPGVTPEVTVIEKPRGFSLLEAAADVPERNSLSAEVVRKWMSEMTSMRLEYRLAQ